MFLSSLSGFVMKFTGEARAPQGSPHPPSTTRRTNSQTCALQLAQGHLQRGATAATEIRCKYKTTQLGIIFPHIISGISTYIYIYTQYIYIIYIHNIYIYIYIYTIYILYTHTRNCICKLCIYIYIFFLKASTHTQSSITIYIFTQVLLRKSRGKHASSCMEFLVTVHQVTFFPRVFFIFRGLAASTLEFVRGTT